MERLIAWMEQRRWFGLLVFVAISLTGGLMVSALLNGLNPPANQRGPVVVPAAMPWSEIESLRASYGRSVNTGAELPPGYH